MDAILEETVVPADQGQTTLVLGPAISPRLDRASYSYTSEEEQEDVGETSKQGAERECGTASTPSTPSTPRTPGVPRRGSADSMLHSPVLRKRRSSPSVYSDATSVPSPSRYPIPLPNTLSRMSSSTSLRSRSPTPTIDFPPPPSTPPPPEFSLFKAGGWPTRVSTSFSTVGSSRPSSSGHLSSDRQSFPSEGSPSPRSSIHRVNPHPIRSQVSMDAIPNRMVTRAQSLASQHSTLASLSRSDSSASQYSEYAPSYNGYQPFTLPIPPRRESIFPPQKEGAEDEGDDYAESFRNPVNAALRSAPGVMGLGEGWAGGPQRKGGGRRRWLGRKQTPREEDPLALWNGQGPAPSMDPSPLRKAWNRSKSLFGASTTALDDQRGDRSPSRAKAFFSRSKVNLSGPPAPSQPSPQKAKRHTLSSFFGRSAAALTVSRSTGDLLPSSPSTPVLESAHCSGAGTPPQSFSRSETHLAAARLFPLPPTGPGGSSPARRPLPTLTTKPATPRIPELDESHASHSSTSLETPKSRSKTERQDHVRIQSYPAQLAALERTTTFGMRQSFEDEEAAVGLDTLAAWADEGRDARMSGSFFRTPTPSPARASPTSPSRRRDSVLFRFRRGMTSTLTFSNSTDSLQGVQETSVPARTPSSFKTSSSEVAYPKPILKSSKSGPRQGDDPNPSAVKASNKVVEEKRLSWLPHNDSHVKRLSRLTEADEEDQTEREEKQKQKRRSFISLLKLPVRSSSLQRGRNQETVGALSLGKPLAASASMPALSEDNIRELDLREEPINSEGSSDHARGDSLLSVPSRSSSPSHLTSPDLVNETAALSPADYPLLRIPSHSRHRRGLSAPIELSIPSRSSSCRTATHSRHLSEPTDNVPVLEEHTSHLTSSTTEGTPDPATPPTSSMNMHTFPPYPSENDTSASGVPPDDMGSRLNDTPRNAFLPYSSQSQVYPCKTTMTDLSLRSPQSSVVSFHTAFSLDSRSMHTAFMDDDDQSADEDEDTPSRGGVHRDGLYRDGLQRGDSYHCGSIWRAGVPTIGTGECAMVFAE